MFTPENVRENNRWVVDSWSQALEDAYYADPKVQAAESPETWAPKTYPAGESFDEVGRDATITHIGHFVEAIRSRQVPNEPADRGHHAAAGAHMVNMSIRQQRVVDWDFDKDTVRVTS